MSIGETDQFVGEIRVFAFNFAPIGWALCEGQLLPIAQNTALFSLLGTTFGGDGKVTFGLPDLRDRVPVNWGQGPGLSDYFLGQMDGAASVSLILSEMPVHTHAARAVTSAGTTTTAANNSLAAVATGGTKQNSYSAKLYSTSGSGAANMSASAIDPAGGGQPHNNMMPSLTLNYCIALQGIFPQRK